MASLLVVTGPPGAGKSTVAAMLASRVEPSVLVAGDDFFGFLARGAIPPWLPESDRQNEVVTQAAGAAAGRFVTGGFQTVYDGVVGPWFLPVFAAATGCDGLDYVVLLPPVERCLERVASRVGHGFTDAAATRTMHRAFAVADLDPRHLVLEPSPSGASATSDTPESVVERIEAARAGGRLTYEVTGRPSGVAVPLFVVVSGPPGSGKSTIARPLAHELGLPLVAKDTIKEAVMSTTDVEDVAASQAIGRAAVAAMFAVAAASPCGAVIDCNLHRSAAVTDLRNLPGRVVEVFCRCDRTVALDRYRARSGDRAPGHFDADRSPDDIWHDDVTEPVAAGWPVIEVDTNHTVDTSVLRTRIRATAGAG